MANNTHHESTLKKPIIAAVTGAAVGAGIAVAGTAVLKDEKRREKVKGMLKGAKNKAVSFVREKKDVAENKVEKGKGKVERKVQAAKKTK